MSIFSHVPVRRPRRTPHNLSHPIAFTPDFGQLTPVCCEKCIPGDSFLLGNQHQEQFAALSSKLYHDFRVKTETWFVPSRLLWRDFGEFMVDEDNNYIHPSFTIKNLAEAFCTEFSSGQIFVNPQNTAAHVTAVKMFLYNFFGSSSVFTALYGSFQLSDDTVTVAWSQSGVFRILPKATYLGYTKGLDLLRYLAYYLILIENYCDENLQDELIDRFKQYFLETPLTASQFITNFVKYVLHSYCFYSGLKAGISSFYNFAANLQGNQNLARGYFWRCWPKDYFAGALPFVQKGKQVSIPIQGDVNIDLQLSNDSVVLLRDNTLINNANYVVAADQTGVPAGFSRVYLDYQNSNGGVDGAATRTEPVQISATTTGNSTSIEDFRTAYQLQEWLEKNARGGTRYKEQIFAHFGVRTRDSRLDRPEFLFGTTDGVNYGNVFTTFQNAAGDGVPAESVTAISSAGKSRRCVYNVTEHGYIITLHSLYPRAVYAQGLLRQAMELDKFDYYWPEFQHLGEQEVFLCEIHSNAQSESSDVFGYQPRYSQYKSRFPRVMGDFVTSLPTFTDYRELSSNVRLDGRFLSIIPQYSNLYKIFNYVSVDFAKIYVYFFNEIRVLRPMDYYGIPRLQL